jgi:hypothetical protein
MLLMACCHCTQLACCHCTQLVWQHGGMHHTGRRCCAETQAAICHRAGACLVVHTQ